MKISVVLTTYNGEKYLKDQLDSINNQISLPHELLIGDDGSSDNTLNILEEFIEKANFPVYIFKNKNNVGHAVNFLNTAQSCSGDYISFCDQDDVWLPNKIQEVNNILSDYPEASLVLQKAFLCDKNAKSSGVIFPDYGIQEGFYKDSKMHGFWVWPGFLQTVRSDIIKIYSFNKSIPMNWFPNQHSTSHDKFTCIIANAFGGIVIKDEPIALYRRHDKALTGSYKKTSFLNKIIKAKNTLSSDYDYKSSAAIDISNYLKNISNNPHIPRYAPNLKRHSKYFKKFSRIQSLRSILYSEESNFIHRFRSFIGLLREGGYFGNIFWAMGMKSFIKDLTKCFYNF